MANQNGYVKLTIFVTVIALLTSGIAGSYMFSLSRVDNVRLEMKHDIGQLRSEMKEGNQEILREIRMQPRR